MKSKGFFFFWWGGDKVIQETLSINSKCKFCKKKSEKLLIYYFTRYTMYSIIPFGRKKLKVIEYYCPSCGLKTELLGEDFSNAEQLYADTTGKEVINHENKETILRLNCDCCGAKLESNHYEFSDGSKLCADCNKNYEKEWFKKIENKKNNSTKTISDKCSNCGSTKTKLFWDYPDGTILCDKCEKEISNQWEKEHSIKNKY